MGERTRRPRRHRHRAAAQRRSNWENDLSDRALKEVKTTKAVAGYVFFPKAKGKQSGDFEILYFGETGQISIKAPPAK